MTLDELRSLCLPRFGVTEERPFGPDTVVFKVMNKMFALCADKEQPNFVNLKCDPDDALFFRDRFPGVTPGYHMDKRTWNSVSMLGDVPESLIEEMVDDSYELIVASLPKKIRSQMPGRE